jgi:hypothetical protein
MSEIPRVSGFAPSDPTDGRDLLDWKSLYPIEARKEIFRESCYLALLLVLIPLLLFAFWLEYPKYLLRIPEAKYPAILKFGTAWLAGTLGGTLFDLKWLYHSVARRMWHMDRRLWRVFTPHISGGLSFAVVALISSGIVRIFDSKAVESLSLIVGISFLVGYFSDSAIAKLSELAETLFGASRSRSRRIPPPKNLTRKHAEAGVSQPPE